MKERKGSANGMLIFLIYGMFALFSLFLVVIGANVYRDVVTVGDENTAVRATFSYVANKVRMNGGDPGEVRLEQREGVSVLVLPRTVGTEEYETLIYCYDGVLKEYFGKAGQDFAPGAGEKIVNVREFVLEEDGPGMLCLSALEEDGTRRSMHLNIQGSEER